MASGLVFNSDDLKNNNGIVCGVCDECYPYRWDDEFKCALVEAFKLGGEENGKFNPTLHILDRRSGFDYGKTAPCALTIVGRKENKLFTLYSDEMRDDNPLEILNWTSNKMKEFDVEIFIPDPAIAGQEITRRMSDSGYSVWILEEGGKDERVWRVRRIIERHSIIIPKAYWKLIGSMRQLSWDNKGKIKKFNDHSFDTMQYSTEGFDELVEGDITESSGIFQELLKEKYIKEVNVNEDSMKGIKIW